MSGAPTLSVRVAETELLTPDIRRVRFVATTARRCRCSLAAPMWWSACRRRAASFAIPIP